MDFFINGKKADVTEYEDDTLVQAVLISLFSWRRSDEDDGVEIPYRQGWWGDTFVDTSGDRIGSKLWLLEEKSSLVKLSHELKITQKNRCDGCLKMS